MLQETSSHMRPSAVLKLQFASSILRSAHEQVKSIPQVKKKTGPSNRALPAQVAEAPLERVPVPHLGRAGGTSLSQMAKADLRSIFKAELRAEIEKNKSYPTMSRRLGQTGTVVVAFTLLEDGHIIDIRLDTPSRFAHLNESAMNAVKKIQKFKPIPGELGEGKMEITVPVTFFTI